MYQGEFLLDLKNGDGVTYDGATGAVLEEGTYRDGILVREEKKEKEGDEEEKVSEEATER